MALPYNSTFAAFTVLYLIEYITTKCYLSSLTYVPGRKGKYYGLNSVLDSNKHSSQKCEPELKHL